MVVGVVVVEVVLGASEARLRESLPCAFPRAPAFAVGSVGAARLPAIPGRPGPNIGDRLLPLVVAAFPTRGEFIIDHCECGGECGGE